MLSFWQCMLDLTRIYSWFSLGLSNAVCLSMFGLFSSRPDMVLYNTRLHFMTIFLLFVVALMQTLSLSTKLWPQLYFQDFFTFTLVQYSEQVFVNLGIIALRQ